MADTKHEFSPMPSEALRYFFVWLRGFHRDREKSKASDWIMVILTLFAVIAAVVSALFFQEQLVEARRSTDAAILNFRVDERAWVELEPIRNIEFIKGDTLRPAYKYEVRPKNIGKTVATDVVMKVQVLGSVDGMGDNAQQISMTQDKFLRNEFTVSGTNEPVEIPQSPISRVLAPNTIAPVPFVVVAQAPQIFKTGHGFYDYLVGRIDYIDEFKVTHWIKFCYFAVNQQGELRSCKYGNDEDHNSEPIENQTSRASNHSLWWSIFIALVTGVFTSLLAAFFYAMFTSRIRDQHLKEQFSKLEGEYQEAERNAQGSPVAVGKMRLTYCGGTKFETKSVMENGESLWKGEIFMNAEAGVLGTGFYSHTNRDDTGIHEVVYNPVSGHFNVSGQNTSHGDGRKFKMVWFPMSKGER